MISIRHDEGLKSDREKWRPGNGLDFWPCLNEGQLWAIHLYFVNATHTSKESSLNADINAAIKTKLSVETWPKWAFSFDSENRRFFYRVANVNWILYFIKRFDSVLLHKIVFVTICWNVMLKKFHGHSWIGLPSRAIQSYGAQIENWKNRPGYHWPAMFRMPS